MKFRKKSGIAQNQEKSGIIRKIRKCLTDCYNLLLKHYKAVCHVWLWWHKNYKILNLHAPVGLESSDILYVVCYVWLQWHSTQAPVNVFWGWQVTHPPWPFCPSHRIRWWGWQGWERIVHRRPSHCGPRPEETKHTGQNIKVNMNTQVRTTSTT